MSNVPVAEVSVRIRADTTDFKQEAAAEVNAAVKDIQAAAPVKPQTVGEQIKADILARQMQRASEEAAKVAANAGAKAAEEAANRTAEEFEKKIGDIQLRAAAASIRGEDIKAQQLNVLAAIETVTAAAVQSRAQLKAAVGADQAAQREFLTAQIAQYEEARRRLETALKKSQLTGKAPELGGGGGGALGKVGEFARASGREGGLGGLIAVGSRLGLIGFAATAAFQAVGELQQSLRVTGDEAFTTEGKLRNLGAELLGGNIIGGIKALTASRQAEISSTLVARFKELKDAQDPLIVNEQKLLTARQRGRDALDQYIDSLRFAGAISDDEADNLRKAAEQLFNMQRGAETAATALQDVATKLAAAGSEAAAFGERGNEFGRGVGAIQAQAGAAGGRGAPTTDPTATAAVSAAVRQSIAARTASLADDVKEAQREVDEIAKRNQNLKQITEGRAQRYRELVEAQTRATGLEQQLAAQQRAADEANLSASSAIAASLASRTEGLGDDLAAAKAAASKIEARNAAMKGVEEGQKQRNQQLVEAETRVVQIEQQQAALAAQRAQEAQNATEAALQNDLARAALTKRKSDDRKAFDALISYYQSLIAGATRLERENFEGKIIQLRSQRAAALKPDPGQQNALREAQLANQRATLELQGADLTPVLRASVKFFQGLVNTTEGIERAQNEAKLIAAKAALQGNRSATAELKLQNQRARAALTEGIEDDKSVILKQIERAKAIVKNTRGLAREQARAKLIGFQADLKGLTPDKQSAGSSVLDLLTASAERFKATAGNLINKDQPFAGPTEFTADMAQFLRRQEGGDARSAEARIVDGFQGGVDRLVAALEKAAGAFGGDDKPKPGVAPPKSGAVPEHPGSVQSRWREAHAAKSAVGAAT